MTSQTIDAPIAAALIGTIRPCENATEPVDEPPLEDDSTVVEATDPEPARQLTQVADRWEQGLGVYIIGHRHDMTFLTFDEYLDQVLTFLVERHEDPRFNRGAGAVVSGEVSESLGL